MRAGWASLAVKWPGSLVPSIDVASDRPDIFRKKDFAIFGGGDTKSTVWFLAGSVYLSFEQVPLGRFYSSRPSSRSRSGIVSE
jgi:hypothetical protein